MVGAPVSPYSLGFRVPVVSRTILFRKQSFKEYVPSLQSAPALTLTSVLQRPGNLVPSSLPGRTKKRVATRHSSVSGPNGTKTLTLQERGALPATFSIVGNTEAGGTGAGGGGLGSNSKNSTVSRCSFVVTRRSLR